MNNVSQPGKTITFANSTGSDIASGAVVPIGPILAVAAVDIANGSSGECVTEGVYEVPKVAGTAFTQGEQLIWDVSGGEFVGSGATPATGDVSGAVTCWAAAASAATTCFVKLTKPGSVT